MNQKVKQAIREMAGDEPVDRAHWRPVVFEYIDSTLANSPNMETLSSHNPELYRQICFQECKINEMANETEASMLDVLETLTQWRALVLRAQFDRR